MGKINRRRNTNKKTGTDAASATATATTTALVNPYSASSGTNPCYHGSTADKFQPGSEYLKAIEEYLNMHHQGTLLNNQDSDQLYMKYEEDHRHLIMKNPEFYRFIFAICTQMYLAATESSVRESSVCHKNERFRSILCFGAVCIKLPHDKLNKKLLDALTERGVINILVRETKSHCKCMNEAKKIAKTLDKVGQCHGCKEEFPKLTLRLCNGCQVWKYHSPECQRNDWAIHREDCKKLQALKLKQGKRNGE